MKKEIVIPADVPASKHNEFVKNYTTLTHGTGNLFLFTATHKTERMNTDFYGPGIDQATANPEHLFNIAQQSKIAMATQLGLIARYGNQFPIVPYVAKLNARTNLIPKEESPPVAPEMWTVEKAMSIKKESGLDLCGIAYTIYLGSQHERYMTPFCAKAVFDAHQHGLVTIVSAYPHGRHVPEENTAEIIAGAAGFAACLGADFVKVKLPESHVGQSSAELLMQATQAAGNTKVICYGGPTKKPEQFLDDLYEQMNIGGTCGTGVGRNLFQKPLDKAVTMSKAISAIVYDGKTADEAKNLLKK